MSNPKDLANLIGDFVDRPRSILFAGSGVACRVGYPTWRKWILSLGNICKEYGDELSGKLISHRVEQGDYLGAATVYKTCTSIPIGERLSRMAAPFTQDPANIERIEPLISLPFTGIVTTNYDRSFYIASAKYKGNSPLPLELNDQTLRNAALISEFFIARLHGRSQLPNTMIVDNSDYEQLKTELDYKDFVISILRQRPTLFLGFSFLDPAINHILDLYEESFSPHYPELHLAVVPQEEQSSLIDRLSKVNIRTVGYDSSKDSKGFVR